VKRFSFQLESVLKIRSIRKKIAEKALSLTQSKLNKVSEETDQVRLNREHSYHFEPPRGDPVFWMDLCGRYREGLNIRESELRKKKEELTVHLQLEKKELIAKLKDEKVMSALKDTQYQAYMAEMERVEQKEIEEIDILKRGKKK
jgi:flagellar export protein FliJ